MLWVTVDGKLLLCLTTVLIALNWPSLAQTLSLAIRHVHITVW